ncbi:MAG: BlaI/MecI/CopY family transcriptional regulator [Acidobacteriota bacterium]
MPQKTIGDQELALLREVDAAGSLSVAEAAEQFGGPRALARSTVLTMLERLRAKGHLKRASAGGSYRYSAAIEPDSLAERALESFVAKTLGGSVTPLVAFLAERGEVSAKERAELERLLDRLKSKEDEA